MSPVLRAGPVSQARFEALKILVRVEGDRAFADIALEHALERAALEPRDAALCLPRSSTARSGGSAISTGGSPHLHRPLTRLDPWVRALLRLTAYQVLFLDRVPLGGGGRGGEPGQAEVARAGAGGVRQRGAAGAPRAPGTPTLPADPVEASKRAVVYPDWIVARWLALRRRRRRRSLAAGNGGRASRCGPTGCASTARRSLRGFATRISPRPVSPSSPRRGVLEKGAAARLGPFAEGWCTVQDEASMLIARLLDPRPGETVADVRGAGRKATHLAELMDNRGRLIAFDPQAARLALLDRGAARLGISIVQSHVGRAALAPLGEPLRPRARGRAVLNLGVLRRNPEVKWRRTEDDLRRLRQKQRTILDAAANMVKPGGRLVYATCSPEPEENEDVVEPFLESHGSGRWTRRTVPGAARRARHAPSLSPSARHRRLHRGAPASPRSRMSGRGSWLGCRLRAGRGLGAAGRRRCGRGAVPLVSSLLTTPALRDVYDMRLIRWIIKAGLSPASSAGW